MSEDGTIVATAGLTVVMGISVAAVVGVSFLRAVVAAASATRLDELRDELPHLLEPFYDARRLSSPQRTLLMILDTASVATAAASASMVALLQTHSIMALPLVAVIVLSLLALKSAVHLVGDLVADVAVVPVARVLGSMLAVFAPLVQAIETLQRHLHAPRRTDEEAREQVEEELTAIMEEAVEEGTLDAGEVRIVQNIMRFSEVRVEDVMTPRNVIAGLPAEMPIAEAARLPELQTYSRLPVWEGSNIDNIVGYVLSRDVLVQALVGNGAAPVRTLVRNVVFIPAHIGLDQALEEFLKRRQHMFIVVDEYGGVEGLLTLEDVVETILGTEIVDEADRIADLRQLAQQQRDRRIAQQGLHSTVEHLPSSQ